MFWLWGYVDLWVGLVELDNFEDDYNRLLKEMEDECKVDDELDLDLENIGVDGKFECFFFGFVVNL